MMNHHRLGIVFVASVAFVCTVVFYLCNDNVYSFLTFLDYFEDAASLQDSISDEGCIKIMSIGATEDQTKFNNNAILMTEWRVVGYKKGENRPGAMYVASGFYQKNSSNNNNDSNKSSSSIIRTEDFVSNKLKIEKLPFIDYPEGINFHPHGIYIRKEDRTLYVINHAYEKGGERIDVFRIITTDDDDIDDDIPIRLDYKYSITSDWMKKELNGIINSIVVVEENKFYITQYEAEPHQPSTFMFSSEFKKGVALLRNLLLGSDANTNVFYCEYTPSTSTSSSSSLTNNLDCREVADQFEGANGITHNTDYSKIFVASWKSVTVFDRDSATNNLSGRTTIHVPNLVDNIKYDDITGNIYGGTMNNLWSSLIKNPYPKESNETIGGVMEFYQDDENNNDDDDISWKTRQVVTTSKLNSISNGIRMNDYYVIGAGGLGYKGLLVCPVVDQTTMKNNGPDNGEDSTPVVQQPQSEL
jgi:hypothetical protein